MNMHVYHNKSKEELVAIFLNREKQILERKEKILDKDKEIAYLKEILKPYTQPQSIGELGYFDEAEIPQDPTAKKEETVHVEAHRRKPLPANFPREQRIYDLREAEKQCSCCYQRHPMNDEICEQLEMIPDKMIVIEHIKRKYACTHCEEQVKIASMPPQPIPRSIAGPGLLSHIFVSKYEDHFPLHHQEKILQCLEIDIPSATMSFWVLRSAELLERCTDKLKETLLKYDIAYANETTVQVIKEPKKSIASKKYMWLFSGGPPEQFCYYYHPSGSQEVPKDFFEGFQGYLHCTGKGAYDALAKSHPVILVGSLYHARRKFFEVAKLSKKRTGVAHKVLDWIGQLAQVEKQAKELSPTARYHLRLQKAKPILEEWHGYLLEIRPRVPPKSALGEAIHYTLHHWPKLIAYLRDGRLENNNNRSERAIKPFTIGRKGWLFSNSVAGAKAGAILYSLIKTCKHHHIEPYYWFKYVLQQLPLRGNAHSSVKCNE